MSKKNIQINIKAEELRKKLNIKNGKKGEKGDKGDVIFVDKIIEKVEVIKEVPNEETGEEIVEKINKLSTEADIHKIDFAHLKNVPEFGKSKPNGGGWRNLWQMNDVSKNVLDATNDQVLKYNSTTGLWEAGAGGGSGTVTTNSSLTGDGSGGSPLGINLSNSNTWTASQTFLEDTIFSEPDPVSSNTLKLIYYTKTNVLFQESWSLGYNNSLPVADLSQIVIGNNNTMSSFAGFIGGFGNTATTTEDIFLLGLNNTASSTSAGIGIGIANALGGGSLQFAIGHTNTLGNFNNLVAVGLTNTNGADSTVAVGINLNNTLASSLDIGISDATKATLTTTYGRFRTDVGIGTIPSAGLHVLKTTEQLRLGYDASNYVTTTVSSAGLLSWQTTAGATAGIYTLTPHGSGGSGTNRTLSFGRAWANPALLLYDNGAGARFGWGMQNDAMQFFSPSTTGTIFTWNKGGDLQPNGTNELLRLTQYASGTGAGLGMGSSGFASTTPYRIDFQGVSATTGSAGVEGILRFSRIQTGGVSYPEAFSIALGRYSSSGTGPDTRVDLLLKATAATDYTTGVMVMSLQSNGNVGFGVTPATAVIHLKAGTATASTAPLKFTTGTNLTTAEVGVMEYNNTFHLTNSDATRRHVVTAPNTTKVTAAAPYTNDGYVVINIGGTDFRVMTTA